MKKSLAALAAVTLLGACADETEVVVVDPVEDEEVAYENVEADAASWDANSDELIDEGEFLALSNTGWGAWNTDADGALSRGEFESGWTNAGFANGEGMFESLDSDGDGVVRQADFLNRAQWDSWDKDASGVLEPTEFPYYR